MIDRDFSENEQTKATLLGRCFMRKYIINAIIMLTFSTSIANASPTKDLSANEYLAGAEACYRLRLLQQAVDDRLER
ncbi:hypothetical protein [Thalassospira lucentensis]|uniref:hypothetical protein n=1 Tax=Thalassospira lucentensis TaxID=168935 RepID=UPI003AA921F1